MVGLKVSISMCGSVSGMSMLNTDYGRIESGMETYAKLRREAMLNTDYGRIERASMCEVALQEEELNTDYGRIERSHLLECILCNTLLKLNTDYGRIERQLLAEIQFFFLP